MLRNATFTPDEFQTSIKRRLPESRQPSVVFLLTELILVGALAFQFVKNNLAQTQVVRSNFHGSE